MNFNYPHAWRYRDYVIAAFNADKPYDQFVREQLAGDLMPSDDPKVKAERIDRHRASSRSARRRSTSGTACSSSSTWPTSRST